MIDPIRSRNRVLVVFGSALIVFVPALLVPRNEGTVAARTLLLIGSLAAVLISGVWLIVRADEARRLARLRAGVGVIAQWTVDVAQWTAFGARSAEWDRRDDITPNDVDFTKVLDNGGVDIAVARDGVLVGRDFFPLEHGVRITARADWMEFFQVVPKARGTPLTMVVRVPLAPGHEASAVRIADALRQHAQATGIGRRGILVLGVGLVVGVPAVAALAYAVARVTGWIG